jgi:hypothetical protein
MMLLLRNIFYMFSAVLFLFILSSANALEPDKNLTPPNSKPTIPIYNVPKVKVTATGLIEKMGKTSYMYGTHVLKNLGFVTGIRDAKSFALKSDNINLNQYIGKEVEVSGELIEGYPVDGGPEYINVKSIKVLVSP